MASTKPQTPLKPAIFGQNMSPALQKFMNKQNEILGGKDNQGSVSGEVNTTVDFTKETTKSSFGSGVNETKVIAGSVKNSVVSKPPVGATKPPENRRGSQVNVPNIFMQDSPNSSTLPESRRGSQVNVPDVFKQNVKNASTPPEANTDENKKPKPFVKPGAVFPRPPVVHKPQQSANAELQDSDSSVQPPFSLTKKPSDMKSEEKKHGITPSESVRVKLPAVEHVSLKSINSTTATGTISSSSVTSQPPSSPVETKVVDFRSVLRPTKTQPENKIIGKSKPAAIKPVFPPLNSSPTTENKVSQELKRLNNSTILERKSDSKKFKKVKLELHSLTSSPPQKPELPDGVDLTLIKRQYEEAVQFVNEGEVEDIYDDGVSVADVVKRQPISNRQSERISMIPDMTEEEEEGGFYDDGHTPLPPPPSSILTDADDLYVDAETERQQEEDLDQLYEDEETFSLSVAKLEEEKRREEEEERKRRQKEEAEIRKREEKERKEKEKEEEKRRKKEEKEKAKKEKELMQLRKKFNLTGDETNVGEGIIKQDIRVGVLGGWSLKKGQTVTIVRLDNNPPNKWLIKSDSGMGYIDSSNIEVDTSIIRQAMVKGGHPSRDDDDDQPLYDDVAQDGHRNDLEEEFEIYEECP